MDKDFENKFVKIPQKEYSNGFKLSHDKLEKFTAELDNNEITAIKTIEDFYYCFRGYDEIKYRTSTGKLFMFAISKLKEDNVSRFYANEYIELRGFSRNSKAMEQLKEDLETLAHIDGVRYQNKKSKTWQYSNIVCTVKIVSNYVTITFNEEFVDFIKQMYFWLPKILFKIKDRHAPHSWTIGYEVFKYIMQNSHARNKEYHNRTITSLINTSNLQNLKDTKRLKEYLYTPFRKSLICLNNIQDQVEVSIPEYTKNFLNEKITVKILDKQLIECYKSKIKKTLSENTVSKHKNLDKTLELRVEGKTIKEIATFLNVSPRTINNYITKLKNQNRL